MARKPVVDLTEDWRSYRPHQEEPVLADTVDPQVHASLLDRDQPFFLVCEKDTMLAFVWGEGSVEFHDSNVNRFSAKPGDFIYVPARTPHRIYHKDTGFYLRYKAKSPGLEAAAFYCDSCGNELYRETWAVEEEGSQGRYWQACSDFNEDQTKRTCDACGTVAEPVDLTGYGWQEQGEPS